MRLTSVHLKNVSCFDELTLDFTDANTGKPCSWIVILGENGTGKSTVLQMIGAALLQSPAFYRVAGQIAWDRFIRGQSSTGELSRASVELSIRYDAPGFDTGEGYVPVNSRASIYIQSYSSERSWRCDFEEPLDDPIARDLTEDSSFACGYGSARRTSRSQDTTVPTVGDEDIAYRFATLFGDESRLTNTREWLADLYFRTIHPRHTDADKKRYDLCVVALEKTLPGIKIKEITLDRDVIVTEAGMDVSLDRLSDGYRSAMAWISDLVRRLCDAFPDSSDPLQESGVVMVDEIDLHLHPNWQRTIVSTVRRVFPNLQFIVTSHSPFVAQDMTHADKLIVLKRKGNGPVRSIEGAGFAKGWRADQILTSYLFDLPGTRDDSILKAERQYRRLLEIEESRALSDSEQKRRDRLQYALETKRSSADEFPDIVPEVYESTDALLSALESSAFSPYASKES